MGFVSEVITLVVFFIIGFYVSHSLFKKLDKKFDFIFLVMLLISFWLGRDTSLIRISSFNMTLADAFQGFSFGILIQRYIFSGNYVKGKK